MAVVAADALAAFAGAGTGHSLINGHEQSVFLAVRRQSVPVTELMTMFQDLPPMSAETFRADQDRYADAEAYFDAYERVHEPEDGE